MIMMKPTAAVLFLVFALLGTSPVSAQDGLVRLIPQPVLPPPVISTANVVVSMTDAISVLAPQVLQNEMSNEARRLGKLGLQEAAKQGQVGALFKVRVASLTVGTETLYYPVGTGVSLVGVGPTPHGVLHVNGLPALETALPPGTTLDATMSYYLWLEETVAPGGKQLSMRRFDIAPLEGYMRIAQATEAASAELSKATTGAYLQGYSRALVDAAATQQAREMVQALLASRQEAIASLDRVEQQLRVRMEQAQRAARVAATWSTLSTVLSIGSSVAMASASMGRDLKNPDGTTPSTSSQLDQAIRVQANELNGQVRGLREEAQRLRQRVDGMNRSMFNQGARSGLPANPAVERLIFYPWH